MDPSFLSVWPGSKTNAEQQPSRGNVAVSWEWRKLGINPRGSANNSKILQEAAEDHLVNKSHLTERSCELPGVPKSTFLMVFSPDGTIVASTHGNHQIYVSELSSGKHVKTLSGHPRTPWCIAFHPSRTQLLGSGCLGGQVRVWDLNGGSETWTVSSKTVIASIAFHPKDRLLVIATYNELYFWDWSQPQPFTKVQTNSIKEKVRFVAFDTLGQKLITGISICPLTGPPGANQQSVGSASEFSSSYTPGFLLNPTLERNVPRFYSQLVHRYNNLLRNYRHLFVTQQAQLNTTDRGTDPMEIETNQNNQQPRTSNSSENVSNTSESSSSNPWEPIPLVSETRRESENQVSTENENNDAASSLNLDVQSISLGNTSTVQQPPSTRRETTTTNTMTFVTTSFPRVTLGRNLFTSAFRPSFGFGNRSERFGSSSQPSTESDPPTQNTPSTSSRNQWSGIASEAAESASNRSLDSDFIRDELTASLTRLQGYMENSIDETLNIIESHDLVRAFPASTPSSTPSPVSLSNCRNTPPTDTFVRNPQVNGVERMSTIDNDNGEITRVENRETNNNSSETNPRNMTFEQHLGNIMRDSSNTFMNLVTESAEFNTVRQILQYFHRQRNRRNSLRDRSRSPTRTIFMSSDDGSDSDREMFSPLPIPVYGSRYWSNPPTRNLDYFTINRISIDPTNTSTISRHIDHEYLTNNNANASNQSNGANLLRLTDIPAPSRPESPTYPTNMLPSTLTPTTSSITVAGNSNLSSNLNMPSTSRDVFVHSIPRHRPSTSEVNHSDTSNTSTSEGNRTGRQESEAFSKVTRGVEAIKKHTNALINLCSSRPSLPLRQLRRMWEDLRREIISIERQSSSQTTPSYFSLSARARCNLLSNNNNSNPTNSEQTNVYTPDVDDIAIARQNVDNALRSQLDSVSNSAPESVSNSAPGPSTEANPPSTSSSNESRRDTNTKSHNRRTYPPSSRLQTRLRYYHRDLAAKSRLRSYLYNRLNRSNHLNSSPTRRSGRSRVPFNREHELTRVYIRCYARRVLTVMFSIMMDCLEADQLGDQLIAMLRSLKKALGLTCLLLLSQSFNRESQQTTSNSGQHNVEQSPQPCGSSSADRDVNNEIRARIAVQISAANRNNSSNAHMRKMTYYLFKRSQAIRNRNSSIRLQPYRRVADLRNDASPITTTSTVTSAAVEQSSPVDLSQPSTSGLQNVRRSTTVTSNTRESTSQPTTSRTSGLTSSSQHSNSRVYSGLFRRFLNSNFGFIRDINAFRRAENQRHLSESDDVRYRHSPRQVVYRRPPPHRRIFSVAARPTDFEGNRNGASIFDTILNNVVVPLVRVNDVPVSEVQNPEAAPRQPGHVRLGDPPPTQPIGVSMDESGGSGIFGAVPNLILETADSPVHRIQAWDFTQGQLPDIGNNDTNVVVKKCKIHNDASIDISRDGLLLVALLPAQRMRNLTHRLGIYSLDWNCLGDCLYSAVLEQNVVSISLSPCARHLALGLGSRRMSLQPYGRNGIMALIYRLGSLKKNAENSSRHGCLIPIRSLEQSWDLGFTSLNCLRWAPQPGQGLVYANNTGQLKILS